MKNIVIGLCAVAAVACGGSEAKLQLNLTDAPADIEGAKAIKVTIDEVKVHVVVTGDDTQGGEDGSTAEKGKSGWKSVCAEAKEFDLLTLTNGRETKMCDEATIDPGKITQVRLVVSKGVIEWNEAGKEATNLEIPSGTIKIVGNMELAEGDSGAMTLDFDAAESIVKAGSKYQLKPTIKIVKQQ